jgi:hypothetical protein
MPIWAAELVVAADVRGGSSVLAERPPVPLDEVDGFAVPAVSSGVSPDVMCQFRLTVSVLSP